MTVAHQGHLMGVDEGSRVEYLGGAGSMTLQIDPCGLSSITRQRSSTSDESPLFVLLLHGWQRAQPSPEAFFPNTPIPTATVAFTLVVGRGDVSRRVAHGQHGP